MATDFFQEKDRFDFAIDQECIEIFDGENLLCILIIDQALQLKETLSKAFVEWKKVNKKPLDYKKSPDGKCLQ